MGSPRLMMGKPSSHAATVANAAAFAVAIERVSQELLA